MWSAPVRYCSQLVELARTALPRAACGCLHHQAAFEGKVRIGSARFPTLLVSTCVGCRRYVSEGISAVVENSRLKKRVRAHMAEHGVSYAKALRAVTAGKGKSSMAEHAAARDDALPLGWPAEEGNEPAVGLPEGWPERAIERDNGRSRHAVSAWLPELVTALRRWHREAPEPSSGDLGRWTRIVAMASETVVEAAKVGAPAIRDDEIQDLLREWPMLGEGIRRLNPSTDKTITIVDHDGTVTTFTGDNFEVQHYPFGQRVVCDNAADTVVWHEPLTRAGVGVTMTVA